MYAGLTRSASAVGAILSFVSYVSAGVLALAGIGYALTIFAVSDGQPAPVLLGLLALLGTAISVVVLWAQLMLFALVAKYIAVRTS